MHRTFFEKEFIIEYPISFVEQVTEFLTKAIIEGKLRGGERLVENELQGRFGISRGPIREAFRILEKIGLVITTPRKGTFVRNITKKDIEENFPIRGLIEGFAARLAVTHIQQEDIERIESALIKMIQAIKEKDIKSYLKYHSEYHEILIHACRNDTLIEILENLRRHAMWFRYLYFYVEESLEDELQVHQDILDLLIAKDADKLEQLVKDHILNALDKFLQFLALDNGKKREISPDSLEGAKNPGRRA